MISFRRRPRLDAEATPQQTWAERAEAAYGALQKTFYLGDGSGLYGVRSASGRGGRYATAWEFGRALVGTLALAGIPSHVVGERRRSSYFSAAEDRLKALSYYWDSSSQPPGFDGRPAPPVGPGGDKYYDDNAWLGLALLQHHRLTGSPTSLSRAAAVHAFAYPGGWHAGSAEPYPGGIFWVEQSIGAGIANRDRTCTSNAPHAEIAFRLAELLASNFASFLAAGTAIHDWLFRHLYDPDSGLLYDKVMGDGTLDTTLRTYNQGAAIAANVAGDRTRQESSYLPEAEALARRALDYFSEDFLVNHACVFNAIYFRGLLQLHSVTGDEALRSAITGAMQTYAEDAWHNHRSRSGLFSFPRSAGDERLLDQGGMVQILATLAWDPADYSML
jgi:hypothetical protein